jgi:hypothetical protein
MLIIIGITGFAAFISGGHFLSTNTLYHDNLLFFSLFRNNLQCVNQFGHIAWWFPGSQMGWPAYYYSLLGDLPLTSPMMSLLMGVCWIAGRLGIHFNSYLPIYVFYLCFLQPLALTLGAFTFVRQFCKNRHCLLAVVILMAFSPAAVLNATDPGLMEPTAYFLFFCAALIYFTKTRSKTGFLLLCTACMANALLLGFNFILWNVLAIPLLVVLILFYPAMHIRDLVTAFKSVPKKYLLGGALLLAIGAAPTLLAYSQTGDLIRTKIGTGTTYSVAQLKTGNPIDFLAVSLPGYGMTWQNGDTEWALGPIVLPMQYSFNYMGIPVLALAFFGLICGKMSVRSRLIYVLIIFGGMVCLSGASPFMAALFSVPSPLRSNDHYSDVIFRVGGFLIFVVGVVAGLDALMRGGRKERTLFAAVFGVLFGVALLVFIGTGGARNLGNFMFGFFVFMGFLYLAIFIALARTSNARTSAGLISIVVILLFVDVSTCSHLYLRTYWVKAEAVDETPAPDNVGLREIRSDDYTQTLISYKPLMDLLKAGINPGIIPVLKGFSAAHPIVSLDTERNLLGAGAGSDQYNSLGLASESANDPNLAGFLKADAIGTNVPVQITSFHRTYNELHLDVSASDRCLLFLRDAYSKYWHAQVNGANTPVYRALSNFKCLVVPQGSSTVILKFSPLGLPWLLPLAIIVFWFTVVYLCLRLAGVNFGKKQA